MKTLKDLFEVYKPKSPDEQKFVDKHVTIKHKDRNGNGDDVFKGNTKYIKRKEERHGYDVGDDEKVYEEVEDLDESVAKVANHLIKRYGENVRKSHVRSAANDFGVGFVALSHHVRKKLGVNRLDEEQIDESSTPALNAVLSGHAGKTYREVFAKHGDKLHGMMQAVKKERDEVAKAAGSSRAAMRHDTALKAYKSYKNNMQEELELEEKKLTPAEMKKREEVAKAIERENPKMDKSMAYAIATKTAKRVAEGVVPTADEPTEHDKKMAQKVRDLLAKEKKPVKEEAEEIDELSKNTLGAYGSKALRAGLSGDEKSEKRMKGANLASAKMYPDQYKKSPLKAKVVAKEEVEELDEADGTGTYSLNAKHKKHNELVKAGFEHQAFKHKGGNVMHTYWSPGYRNADLQKVLGEETELDEIFASDYSGTLGKFKKSVEAAEAAHAKGNADRRQYHLDNARNRLLGMKSTDTAKLKNSDHYDRYKKLRNLKEEVEDLEELSVKKLTDYTAAASDARRHRGMPTAKLDNRYKGVMRAGDKINKGFSKVHATEEVENLEELSKKTLGSYVKKASTQAFGKGYTGGSMMVRGDMNRDKEEENIGKKNVDKGVRRLAGISKATDKLTKENIINNAIEKFMPELEDYVPMTQEEKLQSKLTGLSESHIHTLTDLFHRLSEDNQIKMLSAIETPEGIAGMLDFALENRGE